MGSGRRTKMVALAVLLGAAAALVLAGINATRGAKTAQRRTNVVVAAAKRTNIIVILTDDQRTETLASMPNVQKLLVKHGVSFANSFVSDSLCCPSRASILTGNYAHTTRVYDNHPPHGGAPAFRPHDAKSTIATWLRKDGYDTGLFGKYLNSYGGGVPPGWDRWVAYDYEPYYFPYRVFTNAPGACSATPACMLKHDVSTYSTVYFGNAATHFINTAPSNKPVFVYYAPYAPHLPSLPQHKYATRFANLPYFRPPNFNRVTASQPPWIRSLPRMDSVEIAQLQADRRAEYQTLITVDNEVGAIVRSLRRTHRLAHSVILFASDNGISWGEHRLAAASKQVPYDEALRVPLVVRYEPATTRPRTDHHLVVNIDWASTLADIAGAPHPKTEGRSFLPLLDDTPLHKPWRTQFLLEHYDGNPPSLAPTFCGIRSVDYMYARYSGGYQELYDLRRDPYELTNIADDPAEAPVIRRMRALLARECNPPPPGYHP
jgi:N-acetylglucosamine-6-sulfatase